MNRIVLFLILAVSSALIAYGDTINGQYNATPPVLIDGQTAPVQLDANGSVKINGSISATNPSTGVNGASAPASTNQIGSVDGSGNLQPASASNPIPVSVTGTGVQRATSASPYCLAGSPTVNAGYFVPTAATTINSSTISLTDGVNTYISALTSTSAGCFIKQ